MTFKTTTTSQTISETDTARFPPSKEESLSEPKSYLRQARLPEVSPVTVTSVGLQSPIRLSRATNSQGKPETGGSSKLPLEIVEIEPEQIEDLSKLRMGEVDLLLDNLESKDFVDLKSPCDSTTTLNLLFRSPCREGGDAGLLSCNHRIIPEKSEITEGNSSGYSANTLMFLFASRDKSLPDPDFNSPTKQEYRIVKDGNQAPSVAHSGQSAPKETLESPCQRFEVSINLQPDCKESRLLSPSQVIEVEAYEEVVAGQRMGFSSLTNFDDTQSMQRAASALTMNFDGAYVEKNVSQSNITQKMVDDYIGQMMNQIGVLSPTSIQCGSQLSSIRASNSPALPPIDLRPSLVKCESPSIIASDNQIIEGGIEIHMFDSQGSQARSSGTARYSKQLNTPSK